MCARKATPVRFPDRAFTVREALDHGVSVGRLKASDLDRPFHGIRMTTRPLVLLDDRCRAFCLRMPVGGVYSHVTAATLYSIPLPLSLSDQSDLHVSVPTPRRAPDARGIAGHKTTLRAQDWDRRFGYPVTTPERTWCDLGAVLSLPDLVAAGDKLIRRRLPQTSRAALDAAVEQYPSRRGIRNLRRALTLLSERSESPRESLLRVTIVLAGFPQPAVNVEVFDSRGRFIARVDLCYPHLKLSLEYQGDQHRTDRAQWQRDLRRTRALQAEGWTELQYSQDDLDDPERFLAELRTVIARLSH
jgi:hypothetical protein